VFNSNFVSIMHHFRDNKIFGQTENDVMVIPRLGGVIGLHNCQFAYFQPLTSYSTFSFCAEISLYTGLEAFYIALGHVNPIGNYYFYCRRNLWGFRGKWHPNSTKDKMSKKHLLRGHFLPYVKPHLLSYRAWKSVHGFGLCTRSYRKTKQMT